MTDKTDTDIDTTAEATGLEAKNKQLIGKLKTANASLTSLQDRLDALEAAQNDAADTTKSEVEKAEGKLQRIIDKLTTQNQKLSTTLATKTIDGAVSAAIAKAGVLPEYVGMLTKALKADASMNDDGEAIADGVSFDDYLGTYFASKEAKAFIAAPQNSGSGAAGSTAKAMTFGSEPKTAEEFARFNELATNSPAEAQSYAKQWGWPTLDI